MIKILDDDLHPHLKTRMLQRGITLEEIETVLNNGWDATDAKPGTPSPGLLENVLYSGIMKRGKVNSSRRRRLVHIIKW